MTSKDHGKLSEESGPSDIQSSAERSTIAGPVDDGLKTLVQLPREDPVNKDAVKEVANRLLKECQEEIEQALSRLTGNKIVLTFIPHLAPLDRGILTMAFARPKGGLNTEKALATMRSFYEIQGKV